jgi:hypothetical protein
VAYDIFSKGVINDENVMLLREKMSSFNDEVLKKK